MDEVVRYTYRLRPGVQAERALLEEWGRCRWLWNEAVHQQRCGRGPTRAKLGKLLTAARRDNEWLRAGWQDAQAYVLLDYGAALDQSRRLRGRGKPVPKSRKRSRPSLALSRHGFSIRDGRLQLPKGCRIPVVWSRALPSDPSSVRIYQDSLGHWYASFVVRRPVDGAGPVDGSVGVDWGIATTATASDKRFDLPYEGYRRRCSAELARAQRMMARRRRCKGQPASTGYKKARRAAAKLHKKALRQHRHAARVWAKRVVRANQLIAIENLRLAFLSKTSMARKAQDAAIGVACRELTERAERAGRKVVLVEPAYTTMTCGSCLTRAKEHLPLEQRVFRCESCGHSAGRDRNAARVILALAERIQSGADGVSH